MKMTTDGRSLAPVPTRSRITAVVSAIALSLALALSFGVGAAEPIPGLGPVGPVKKLHGDFKFTEGPAADREGNVYFSDIPAEKIYKVDKTGALSVFLEPSRHTNGLMINSRGNIVACEMDGRIVEIDVKTKAVKALAPDFEGQRFNAPNDLVIDKAGGVYFTDPRFRAPMPLPQGKEAFYYLSAEGKVTRLGTLDVAPNGVILSPDEKTLYIIPSMQKKMLAYPVLGPGKLGEGKTFGDAWRRYFEIESQAKDWNEVGGDIGRKRAYFWSIVGDCTLRLPKVAGR